MKLPATLSLIIICLISCTAPENTDGFTSSLDSLFTKSIPADEPGGAILIMKGDQIIFSQGYGIADLAVQSKINPQTPFNLGSISKTFVANAILILEAQGKLSVEDSMEKYFSDFKNKEIAQKVKIKNLLTHTSGLPDNRQTRKDSVLYLTAKDAENWYPVTQADSLVFEPGTRYEYSNPAFNGLALIVEQVSGIKWQQFVKENIFDPAGMNTSTVTDGAHPETGVAHAYLKRNGTWIEKDYGEEPTFAAAGNGGVWSSVEELARYEQSLRKATFLSDSVIARSRTITQWPNWEDSVPPSIGWSWFIGQTSDGLKTVGHTGSQGGFLCNYVTVPDKEILFVILCNTPRNVEGFTEFLTNQLIKYNWLEPAGKQG
jgi:CubicO group peptidase (beta-lactamase class C family)